jgi:hypothetical protein
VVAELPLLVHPALWDAELPLVQALPQQKLLLLVLMLLDAQLPLLVAVA